MRSSRWLSLLLAGAATASASACTNTIALDNARPRVTWVAIEGPSDAGLGGDVARVTMWIADVEGNAVDVTARWTAGGESGTVVLAPGSYPLSGLPTIMAIDDPTGQPHPFDWDLTAVPDGAVTLELEVDDTPHDGKGGDVYKATAIDPRAGTSPVTLTR